MCSAHFRSEFHARGLPTLSAEVFKPAASALCWLRERVNCLPQHLYQTMVTGLLTLSRYD